MMPNMQQIMQMLQSNQNPILQNLATMIKNNDSAGIEAFARNLAESQGKDFDKEFASFKSRLGLH